MAAPSLGAAMRIGGDGVAPAPNDAWLGWAAFVLPALGTALTWRLTEGLAFANRVAIAVAAALLIFGVIHVIAKGLRR